jgi:hypothetical protein
VRFKRCFAEDNYGRNSHNGYSAWKPYFFFFYGYVEDREFIKYHWTSPYFPIAGKSQDIVKGLNGD